MQWLSAHPDSAYGVLLLGAYFETLIGTCFFIPGEIFFLSGSILAGAHLLSLPLVMLVLYVGAILGDSSSYYIGRRIGSSVFKEGRVLLSTENYRKGEQAFERYGDKAIFLARLLGPLSWVMPFLAGIYAVPYRRFLPYNSAGVVVGVGQFILVGYLLGKHASLFLPFFHRYLYLLLLIGFVCYVLYRQHKRRKRAN